MSAILLGSDSTTRARCDGRHGVCGNLGFPASILNQQAVLLQRGQDVVYPVMSQKAMTFVGGGAQNFSEWFAFLGLVKDK